MSFRGRTAFHVGISVTLSRNCLCNRACRYFKTNPGNAFIVAFELLLVGVAIELWKGNSQVSDELGVVAFILAFLGVGLQTIASIRRKPNEPTIDLGGQSNSLRFTLKCGKKNC